MKDKVISFLWQHFLLLISLSLLALGVAICVRSNMGSSVISSAPYAFALAGEHGIAPALSLGMYTNILNVLLVMGQVLVLRKEFQPVQLLQLLAGTVFGVLIDISMFLTSFYPVTDILSQITATIIGCTVMAAGVAMEIRCASITMPGEGLPAALSKKTGKPFATMKIFVDVFLVLSAIICMYLFFGSWKWNIVGPGTLFAMLYCGMAVKVISRHLQWFDKMLGYRPGFRRYFYGLAAFIQSKISSR